MKNQIIPTQIDIKRETEGAGLEPTRALASQEEGKKEGIAQTHKRAMFDKEGHLLKRQGHRFRADHLKTYKIHVAIKGVCQQELINKAFEYYRVNVLQRSEAQHLKEAGQGKLEMVEIKAFIDKY